MACRPETAKNTAYSDSTCIMHKGMINSWLALFHWVSVKMNLFTHGVWLLGKDPEKQKENKKNLFKATSF